MMPAIDTSPEAIARDEAELLRAMAQGDFGIPEPAPLGPPQIFMCIQYSPEWWARRRGVATASQFDRILTAKTMKPSAQQSDYIAELIAERTCPDVPFTTERPMSREMADGIDREPEARRWYALETDAVVQQVGFVLTADGRFGCSPDGLVDDGGLELKCPTLKTQVRYLSRGTLPPEYAAQVHGSMIVTGRLWWDFASYAPGLPPLLLRITPDEYTRRLREALEVFWDRYQTIARRIAAM